MNNIIGVMLCILFAVMLIPFVFLLLVFFVGVIIEVKEYIKG